MSGGIAQERPVGDHEGHTGTLESQSEQGQKRFTRGSFRKVNLWRFKLISVGGFIS